MSLMCSHGLAYEVKCSKCFSEAMARCVVAEPVKTSVAEGVATGADRELQEEIDYIQGLS